MLSPVQPLLVLTMVSLDLSGKPHVSHWQVLHICTRAQGDPFRGCACSAEQNAAAIASVIARSSAHSTGQTHNHFVVWHMLARATDTTSMFNVPSHSVGPRLHKIYQCRALSLFALKALTKCATTMWSSRKCPCEGRLNSVGKSCWHPSETRTIDYHQSL